MNCLFSENVRSIEFRRSRRFHKSRFFDLKRKEKRRFFQGRQIISKRISQAGDLIFEDQPLVLAQFEWNKAYKYAVNKYFDFRKVFSSSDLKSCDFCLFPLETCEENVRRLTQNKTIVLPHPELDENRNVQQRIVRCEKCQVKKVKKVFQFSLKIFFRKFSVRVCVIKRR